MVDFVQNTVLDEPVAGIPGMLGDGWAGRDVDTKIVEDGYALTPGFAVELSSVDAEMVREYETSAYGILVLVSELESADTLDGGKAVGVLRKGRAFVDFSDPENAVVGDTPELLIDGQFASTGGTAFTGCRISKVVGSAVEVEINLP